MGFISLVMLMDGRIVSLEQRFSTCNDDVGVRTKRCHLWNK